MCSSSVIIQINFQTNILKKYSTHRIFLMYNQTRNLKFPGGHDAFTNYFAKFVTL